MKKEQGKNNGTAEFHTGTEKLPDKKIEKLRKQPAGEIEKVLHELNVHKIELEMQNEELRNTQIELEESRNKYADLYDCAPVGYFTIDIRGIIIEANLTGCRMLGVERIKLIKKPFNHFIGSKVDQDKYFITRRVVLDESACGRCDLKMLTEGGCEFFAELLIDSMKDKDDKVTGCRVAVIDISKRKKAEQKLFSYQEELRRLSLELSLSEEKIRRQVALRVHDEIAQNLAIAKMRLDSMSAELSSSCDVNVLDEVREMLNQSIENIRSLVNELSVPILYEIGFIPSVRWLTENMHQRFGLSAEFKDDGEDKPLSQNMQVLLFHAIRELLVNVIKHAKAKNVKVTTECVNHKIRITIKDDGEGFEYSKLYFRGGSCGLGLFSIRENMMYAGGSFDIESEPGKGTIAVLKAPLEIVKE
jgi:two-component system, NarL family, sensor histidine kinase UhpB